MSALLYLPAFLVVLVKQRGLVTTIRLCLMIFSVQGLLAYPFLLEHPLPYIKNAFDLGRIFLYNWTVNWRFLSEERFLDPNFAKALLVGHVSVLVAFGLFRWCQTSGGVLVVLNRAIQNPSRPGSPVPVRADGAYAKSPGSQILTTCLQKSLQLP
jgi:alpha-1,3-mannosyltransferase